MGVQRLIDEAGVAKASFYAHFPSKDDLVAAYLDRNGAGWRAKVQAEVLDPDLDPRARLRRMLDVQTASMRASSSRLSVPEGRQRVGRVGRGRTQGDRAAPPLAAGGSITTWSERPASTPLRPWQARYSSSSTARPPLC